MTTTRDVKSLQARSWSDRQLEMALEQAGIWGNDEEVIACLMESPRYKGHIRKAAEALVEHRRLRLAELQKSLEAAEEELRRVSEGEE